MKSDLDRGVFGVWLRDRRKERFDNVPAAVQAMKRQAGYGLAPSVWAELEAGSRRPSQEQRERLQAFFGGEPPSEVPVYSDDGRIAALNGLAVAVEAQTEAMQAIVAELRESRESQKGRDEALAVALDGLAEQLAALRPVLAGKTR